MNLKPAPLTVSQVNSKVRSWLEHEIGMVSVQGEISNLSKPSSGHFYFTLKDEHAQLKCAFFRNRHSPLNPLQLQNGQNIIANGYLSIYEARGDYQLIVEQVTEAGEGDLYRQFELLKKKLAALGLFDLQRKKTLPPYPHVIGIITSPTGAAIQDILTTLSRRYPLAEIYIYPVEVQGKKAPEQLSNAIIRANKDRYCNVLILARGGGSIEDLWAFNDEQLAHSISASVIPIVSGVGHETDFTISDFVADVRAATPTAAAEAVSPNIADLKELINAMEMKLIHAINRVLKNANFLLQYNVQKISSPKMLINRYWQTLDYTKNNLYQLLQQFLAHKKHQLHIVQLSLHAKNPVSILEQNKVQLNVLETKLIQLTALKLTMLKHKLKQDMATLHAVSPLATLDRGYALVTVGENVLRSSQDVCIHDHIRIRLAKGVIEAEVLKATDD